MTQAERARALDTSQADIAKIEKQSPSGLQMSTITRLAAALGGEVKIVILPGRPDTVLAVPKPEARPKRPRARTTAKSGSPGKERRAPV
jgi:transcriptional regulator